MRTVGMMEYYDRKFFISSGLFQLEVHKIIKMSRAKEALGTICRSYPGETPVKRKDRFHWAGKRSRV